MTDAQSIFTIIVQTQGVPLRIGAMIGTAMLIGFILYDNTPNMFYRVSVVFGAFIIFVEWIRMSILDQITPLEHPNILATRLSIGIGLLFLVGLFTGMALAYQFRKKLKRTEEAANEVIEQIRNGNFGTSRINQITKPIGKKGETK